ncbi:MAG: hypothetical protein ABSA02_31295 [Trebonia sp.]|jgi:hypothetical protein
MSWLEILVVIGVIGFVIYQQVAGQAVAGRRLIVLPAVVTVVGFIDLHNARHLHTADIVWLTVGAIGSVLIGLAFGAIIRLESRNGALWAQLPLRGLWLWAALIGWRVLIAVIAAKSGAHVAASTTPLLFTLGLNRLAQAAVIVTRAMAAGIPFAPEQDGRTLRSGGSRGSHRDRSARY